MGWVGRDVKPLMWSDRDRTGGNGFKLKEVVNAPSLEAFKARLDGVLGSLIWWVATSPQQGVEQDGL